MSQASIAALYRDHLDRVCDFTASALDAQGEEYEGIVFHAGRVAIHHADDLEIPFKPTPHFARFASLEGDEHFIVFRPGEPARLIRVAQKSYWVDAHAPLDDFVMDALEVCEVDGVEATLQCVWAMAHGIVSLQNSRPDIEWSPNFTEVALDAILYGVVEPGGGLEQEHQK